MEWLNRVFGTQNHAALSYLVGLVLLAVYVMQPHLRDGGLLAIIMACLGLPTAAKIDLRRWRDGQRSPDGADGPLSRHDRNDAGRPVPPDDRVSP